MTDKAEAAADVERILKQWRDSGHRVNVYVSVTTLGATHRILGCVIDLDGSPGVHAKDGCFALFGKSIGGSWRATVVTSSRGTGISLVSEWCEIFIADHDIDQTEAMGFQHG